MEKEHVIKIYSLNIDEIDLSDDGIMSVIALSYKCKAERIKDKEGKKLEIGAGYLLYKYLGVKCDEDLAYNEYGKPFLKNGSGMEFSLSHSGRYVVLAVSDMPIGVDVESKHNLSLRILKRVLPKAQYQKIENKDYSDEVFYDEGKNVQYEDEKLIWAKKWTSVEAVLKAFGKGFCFEPKEDDTYMDGWDILSFRLDEEYVFSAAFKKTDE